MKKDKRDTFSVFPLVMDYVLRWEMILMLKKERRNDDDEVNNKWLSVSFSESLVLSQNL